MDWAVLDTTVLLGGLEPPQGVRWATTPEAAAEVSPGGRDARRFAMWREAGLEIRAPGAAALESVETTARRAGNWARLSQPDLSVLALALDLGGTLISDDRTVQDIALRMSIPIEGLARPATKKTVDWHPECAGCGKVFAEMPPRDECTVCGSPVRSRIRR